MHDEAKDKAFELELSWICDESNRQHQKVLGYSPKNCLFILLCWFGTDRFWLFGFSGSKWSIGAGQGCCSGSSWGDGCWLVTKKLPNGTNLFRLVGAGEILDPIWVTEWNMTSCQILFQWNAWDVLNGTRFLYGNLSHIRVVLFGFRWNLATCVLLGLIRQLFPLINLMNCLHFQ